MSKEKQNMILPRIAVDQFGGDVTQVATALTTPQIPKSIFCIIILT